MPPSGGLMRLSITIAPIAFGEVGWRKDGGDVVKSSAAAAAATEDEAEYPARGWASRISEAAWGLDGDALARIPPDKPPGEGPGPLEGAGPPVTPPKPAMGMAPAADSQAPPPPSPPPRLGRPRPLWAASDAAAAPTAPTAPEPTAACRDGGNEP